MRQNTLPSRVHGPMRRFAKAFAPSIIMGIIWAIIVSSSIVILLLPDDADRAATKTCDRAVEVLLTSRDPIELQRSGILIHELNCGITRRLSKEP